MIYKTFSGTHISTSPDACLFNKYAFSLFFTKGIVAQKSEFGMEPIIITYLPSPKHVSTFFSKITPTILFHREVELKTKFFFETSKLTSGRCNRKLSLCP